MITNKQERIEKAINSLDELYKEYQGKYQTLGVYYCDGFCDGLGIAIQELEKLKDE